MKINSERERLDLSLRQPSDSKILSEILRTTADHFKNDLNAIWFRSQFFLLFNLGLLTFFSSTGFDRSNQILVLLVSVAGIVISIAWFGILEMTIRWINIWRMALVDVQSELVKFGSFTRGENLEGSRMHELLRPERFATALSVIFALLWVTILILSSCGVLNKH
jgi:hypothetical protein